MGPQSSHVPGAPIGEQQSTSVEVDGHPRPPTPPPPARHPRRYATPTGHFRPWVPADAIPIGHSPRVPDRWQRHNGWYESEASDPYGFGNTERVLKMVYRIFVHRGARGDEKQQFFLTGASN
jgi:hypothetical protein